MSSEAAAYYPDALANKSEARGPARSEAVSSSRLLDKILPSTPTLQTSTKAVTQTDEASDEELLKQVGQGSKEALSILFQRHARSVSTSHIGS